MFNNNLIGGMSDGTIKVWHNCSELTHTIQAPVTCLLVHQDTILLSGGYDGKVTVIDRHMNKITTLDIGHHHQYYYPTSLCMNNNTLYVASSSSTNSEGEVTVWEYGSHGFNDNAESSMMNISSTDNNNNVCCFTYLHTFGHCDAYVDSVGME